jgi:OmpA-OmpF porin, OOP family
MADQGCQRHRSSATARRGRAVAWLRLVVCLLPVALTACMGYDIDAVRDMQPETGDSYTQTLAEEYRRFALFEADEMYDWIDAGHFAVKGLQAGAGTEVEPEPLEDWSLPEETVPQLREARETLMTALETRAAGPEAGELVARAQSNFDCWVEQQEENHQPDDIAACRDGFYSNLSRLNAFLESRSEPVTTPAALPAPPSAGTASRDVPVAVALFAFDSTVLNEAAKSEVEAAVDEALRLPDAAVVVVGHTDRKGSETYNLDLSLRRAEAVRDALIEQGVAANRIDTVARGEWDPAVPTADEVAEPANRRAEIFILPGGGTPPLSSQQTEVRVAPAGGETMDGALRPVRACGPPAGPVSGLPDPRVLGPHAQGVQAHGARSGGEQEVKSADWLRPTDPLPPARWLQPGPCAWRAPNRAFQLESLRPDSPIGGSPRAPERQAAHASRAGTDLG